jgi:hypothetical protein
MNTDNAIRNSWEPLPVDDIPARIPAHVSADDAPLSWRNKHSGAILYIEYREQDDTSEDWVFRGDGSAVATADSLEEIKSQATEYLRNHRDPGPMVVG